MARAAADATVVLGALAVVHGYRRGRCGASTRGE